MITIIFILGIIASIVLKANMIINPSSKYCKEYVVGEDRIRGDVDILYFENKIKNSQKIVDFYYHNFYLKS